MLKLFEVPPSITGADPGFFLGGGALVCCSTSTPINHMVFLFLQNTSCIRKRQVISGGGGVHPLHPVLHAVADGRAPTYLKVWIRH